MLFSLLMNLTLVLLFTQQNLAHDFHQNSKIRQYDLSSQQNKDRTVRSHDLFFPYSSQIVDPKYNPVAGMIHEKNQKTREFLRDCLQNIRHYRVRDIQFVLGLSYRKYFMGSGCYLNLSYSPADEKFEVYYYPSVGVTIPLNSHARVRYSTDFDKKIYKYLQIPYGRIRWNQGFHNHGKTANLSLYPDPVLLGNFPVFFVFGLKLRFITRLHGEV